MNKWIPERIFLCGFMGAGKSTVGRKLAARLDRPFLDLDQKIEETTGVSIPEIFAKDGEGKFRQIERRVLRAVARQHQGILALGGGSLQDKQLLKYLRQQGILIFIEVPFFMILDRISGDSNRPMLLDEDGKPKNRKALEQELYPLYKQRLPFYKQADMIITTQPGQSPDQLVSKLLEKVRNYVTH